MEQAGIGTWRRATTLQLLSVIQTGTITWRRATTLQLLSVIQTCTTTRWRATTLQLLSIIQAGTITWRRATTLQLLSVIQSSPVTGRWTTTVYYTALSRITWRVYTVSLYTVYIAGNFRESKYSWFSNNYLFSSWLIIFVVAACTAGKGSQGLWLYLYTSRSLHNIRSAVFNYGNHEYIAPRKLPAIIMYNTQIHTWQK